MGMSWGGVTNAVRNPVSTVRNAVTNPDNWKTAGLAALTGGLSLNYDLPAKAFGVPTLGQIPGKIKDFVKGEDQKIDQASTLTPEQQALLAANTTAASGGLAGLYKGYTDMSGPQTSNYEATTWTPEDTFTSMNYQDKNAYTGETYADKGLNSYVAPKTAYDAGNSYKATGYNAQNSFADTAYDAGNSYDSVKNWEGEFNSGVVDPSIRKMNDLINTTKHSSNLHSSANRYAQDQVRNNTLDNLAAQRYDNVMKQQALKMQGTESALGRTLSNQTAQNSLRQQGLQDMYGRQLTHLTNQDQLRQSASESAYSRGLTDKSNQDQLRQQGADSMYDRQLKYQMDQNQLRQQGTDSMYTRGLAAQTTDINNRNEASQFTAGQNFQNANTQQALKMQGLSDAQARQQQGLAGLAGLNATALGTRGFENVVTPGTNWMDTIAAFSGAASAGASVVTAAKFKAAGAK